MKKSASTQGSKAVLPEREQTNVQILLSSTLYRYRSVSSKSLLERECEAIRNSYLYWNSPRDFNDPFDCIPAFIFEGSADQRKKRLKQAFETAPPRGNRASRRAELNQALKIPRQKIVGAMAAATYQDIARFGICCLTIDRNNILMWSHYAANHTGICLGFKPSSEAVDFLCAMPVRYSKVRPTYNMMHSMVDQNVFESLVTKSDDWSYEKEWRMIDSRIHDRRRHYPASSLTEVVFGCRISEESQEKVRAAVKDSGSKPRYYKTRIDELEYRLVVEPLD